MNEIEEELLRDGFSITKEDEEGSCCEDDDSELRCAWSIIPVELPEMGDLALGGADAGVGDDFGAGSDPTSSLDSLSAAGDALEAGDTPGALGGLLGGGSGGPSMGAGALAPMAMGLIYPQLKTMLEASIRKVTVRVVWMEGRTERDFSVTQYLTNPQQGGRVDIVDEGEEGAAGAGGTGAGGGASGRSGQAGRRAP
jgi:hypothetical protein